MSDNDIIFKEVSLVMDKLKIITCIVVLGAFGVLQSKIDTLTAELDPYEVDVDDISHMCSLGCAVCWDLEASSHLPPAGNNSYDVWKLDGVIPTAWVEGVDGYGIGEYVLFKFAENREEFPSDSINLNGFRMMNGYCKNTYIWSINARVKRLKIYHNGKPLYVVRLHDSIELQNFFFPEIVWLRRGDEVKVEILSVYPGTKDYDTAISVLEPLGAH